MKFIKSLFLLFCIVFSVSAFATDIPTSMGNGADSYIHNMDPGSNYGTDTLLIVKTDPPQHSNDRKAYIRFDLSEIDGFVSSSQFRLTLQDYAGVHPEVVEILVYGLIDSHPGEGWAENGITWSNAPGNDVSSGTGLVSGEVTLLGSIEIDMTETPAGSQVWLVSSELNDFINADTNNIMTLILVRVQESAAGTVFASKELGNLEPPTLILGGVVGTEVKTLSGVKGLYR